MCLDGEPGVGRTLLNSFDPSIDARLANCRSHDAAVEEVAPKLPDLRAPLNRRCVRSADEPDLRDDDVTPVVRRMFGAQVVQSPVANIPQRIAEGAFYESPIQWFERALAPVFAGSG
jgi:hypothetical protein